jgi:fatty acid desaturase
MALLGAVAWFSLKAVLLYFLAYALLLATLDFFDAFHHTFDQYFTDADAPVLLGDRDRNYEQANTYSNVVSARHPWLNLLTLNFGYHNAHHERASVPWYRLPVLHRELFGGSKRELMSVREVLRSFHRNRLKRVLDDDYGSVGEGCPGRWLRWRSWCVVPYRGLAKRQGRAMQTVLMNRLSWPEYRSRTLDGGAGAAASGRN